MSNYGGLISIRKEVNTRPIPESNAANLAEFILAAFSQESDMARPHTKQLELMGRICIGFSALNTTGEEIQAEKEYFESLGAQVIIRELSTT